MNQSYLDRYVAEDLALEAKNTAVILPGADEPEPFTRADIETLQCAKLRRTLERATKKSAFYSAYYAGAGLDPASVRSLADLAHVPFTEPAHVLTDPYRFACVPIGDAARIVTLTSSGTSGGAKKNIIFTEADLRRIGMLFAVNTKQVLGEKKGIVQIMLPGTTPLGHGHLLGKAIESTGSIAVVTGDSADIAGQIESISRRRCTALVGYSSYLFRLTRLGSIYRDLGRLGIEEIVTAGEPLPPSMQKDLEETWKAKIFSHYGLTETGFNGGMGCGAGSGYHVHEADYIVEVVDPETGLPLDDGEEGELVITSIHREAMSLIRYRTGDVARVIPGPCPCGSALKRIGPVRRRKGATVKVGALEIDTSGLDERLLSIPHIVDYRVVAKTGPGAVGLRFLIQVAGDEAPDLGPVLHAIEEELSAKGVSCEPQKTVEVEFTPPLHVNRKRSVVSATSNL